jgi:hypothetical protein
MNKTTLQAAVVVLLLALGIGLLLNPERRAWLRQWVGIGGGWTAEARRADPVGFVDHAEGCLRKDLENLERARAKLAVETKELQRKVRAERSLRDEMKRWCEELGAACRGATHGDGFPVVVRGVSYTEAQGLVELSQLRTEVEGSEASVVKLEALARQSEGELEALGSRLRATETQVAMMAALRELVQVRTLTRESDRLLAQVDELLAANTRVLHGERVPTGNARPAVLQPAPLFSPRQGAPVPVKTEKPIYQQS